MKKDLIMLSALAFILFMLFAQAIPIIDGDSAFYATIAKNIVNSGDWATLKFVSPNDIIDKPPLAMWIMAVSFKLFGINEFALSLWHALFAIGTILLTYLMARELISRRGGILAALILMLSAQFFYITRTPMLDIPLTFFITCAFYCIFKLDKTENPIYYHPLAALCACALLTKGPVGAAIPIVSFIFYLLLSKRFYLLANIHMVYSVLLFFGISMPWFAIEYKILGQKFIDIFFLRNFLRFLSPTDVIGNLKQIAPQYDFYSYFLQILLLFAPWGGFVYPAITYSFRRKEQRLFLIWAIVGICIFTFSLNYKIGRYILPAFPALAIIVGALIEQAIEKEDELKRYISASAWFNLLPALLLTIGTIFLNIKFPENLLAFRPFALPFLMVFSFGMFLGTLFLFRQKTKNAVIIFTASSAIAYLVFITTSALFIDRALPTKTLMQEMNKIARKNQGYRVIAFVYKGEDPRQEYFYIQDDLYSKYAYMDGPLNYITGKKKLEMIFYINSMVKDSAILLGISRSQDIKDIKQIKIIKEINNYFLFSN